MASEKPSVDWEWDPEVYMNQQWNNEIFYDLGCQLSCFDYYKYPSSEGKLTSKVWLMIHITSVLGQSQLYPWGWAVFLEKIPGNYKVVTLFVSNVLHAKNN